jgi:hypothetical protein
MGKRVEGGGGGESRGEERFDADRAIRGSLDG